ncbi:MAG: hypothetical protein COT34_01245 [Candidatus Nealsonbacteria bacterium CG08_land_8_20_14_0_20_43_11]|uniref:UPF0102 protein COT34_01245 n=1 Tax=Candidatus Nealsonbacteria bacterium CG08_land_8_20_14_0_20_43_11 TaxID=1974706 RepID=A0A2M6T0Q8_9BACT|nr:MAG: hypothetical protein COT34_01245 [Candidatus Nealsonbacteria bacterium CG08_land_8_20_14_0_20_43_11]
MTGDAKQIGRSGEDMAVKYLKTKGYDILDRNFYISSSCLDKGGIDIVAKKDGVIIFVEVKTLEDSDSPFSPEEKANWRKQRKLARLGQFWLNQNRMALDVPWQIDIIAIKINRTDKRAQINHFKNAVS